MENTWRWRPLRPSDLGAVASIAAAAFPDHWEEPACFAERLSLAPSWCFGLEDGSGALKGYLLSWPWPAGSIPPLNCLIGALAQERHTVFIHDLALLPEAAGRGLAAAIAARVTAQACAAGFSGIALVAVNNTAAFWRRQGFSEAEVQAGCREKLAAYGEGARYMARTVCGAAPEREHHAKIGERDQ
jgi:ribosomal protein S18 acetylase RimI-like enzyme